MKVLGIITARGGSKGLTRKNLRPLGGQPLIAWVCQAAKRAKSIDRLICSTDSPEIAEVVAKTGVEVPFLRPAELAQDETLIVDVLCHALRWLEESGETYDYICLIQPTSPFLLPEDIERAVACAAETRADSVITGYRCGQRHPAAMFTMNPEKQVSWLLPAEQRVIRRQDLPPVFMRSGLVYLIRVRQLLEEGRFYGPSVHAFEVPSERAISIDSEEDLSFAEYLITHKGWKPVL